MSEITLTLILLILLFILLGSGLWVAFSLMVVGMTGMMIFSDAPLGEVLATTVWGASNSWALAALPLFIWMGEILFRSRLSEDMFTGLSPWLTHLPGRLLHVNILGCGIFAAVSGSSAATAATIGKMSIPELAKRNYPQNMMIGTLAGSATLGFVDPSVYYSHCLRCCNRAIHSAIVYCRSFAGLPSRFAFCRLCHCLVFVAS